MRITRWNVSKFLNRCGSEKAKYKSDNVRKFIEIGIPASKITMGGEGRIPEDFCGTSCGTFGEGQNFYG